MPEPDIIRLIMVRMEIMGRGSTAERSLKLLKFSCSPIWYEIVTIYGMIRVSLSKQHFIYKLWSFIVKMIVKIVDTYL